MRQLLFTYFLFLFFSPVGAQDISQGSHGKLPLTVSLSFHAISTPFKNIRNNFKNVGIRVGTEFQLNGKGNLLQSLQIGYYRNRFTGNGFYLNSEFIYRPSVSGEAQLDLRVGPGITRTTNAFRSLKQANDGRWLSQRSSKTLLQLSSAVGVCYDHDSREFAKISSMVQYEVGALLGYAPDFPVLPFSFIHAGSKLKF